MACPVKNFLGKKVISKDLWGKNDLEHLEKEVTSIPTGDKMTTKDDNGIVAHVRRVRGGWDIKVHKH